MITKRILSLALLALFASVPFSATSAQVKLYPVDEASKDPSFKRFRARLIVALERRDRKFLLAVLDKNIKNNFGGDGGVKEFVEQWQLNSKESRVWAELLTILSMGGSFSTESGQKMFEAPYVSSRWDTIETKRPGVFDPFSCVAVIGNDVKLHSRPDVTAPVLASLSYDVVHAEFEASLRNSTSDQYDWVKVRTLNERVGFIQGVHLRSPLDYRAGFKRVRGKWVISYFVAGD